jgi:HEAT repeat protein
VLFPLGIYAPVDQLVGWLSHYDVAVRHSAVEALVRIGTPAALAASLVALQDPSEFVRWALMQQLRHQEHPLPVETLIALLDDPATAVRREALLALEARGDPALREPIMSRLTDPNGNIRAVAVRALAALLLDVEHGERIALLMRCYDDESLFVRETVLEELGRVGDPLPWEAIRLRLGDETSYVAVTALRIFEQHIPAVPVDIFLAALGDQAHDVREVAIEILAEHFPAVLQTQVAQALAVLAGQMPDLPLATHLQTCWARTMGEQEGITHAQAEHLMALLDWPYWEVRYKALQALTKHRRWAPDAASTRAGELTSDPDSLMVREAAQALLALGTIAREDDES